ncbi:MAG: coproporphyrinogen III oxidase, partial [Anaerotignaceae bacterium]
MGIITTLTRMWLTKSTKPFIFTNQFHKTLDYGNCHNLGLYVHIPFCVNICSFCPYCKTVYNKETCEKYIDYLIEEIHMVGKMNTEKKRVTSLYFGGGSPALAVNRLGEIIDTLKLYFEITEGIGLELHPSDVNKETLLKLKLAG